jgi:hypothetical protein
MPQSSTPPLLPFNGGRIPKALKDLPRWAPWKAVWSEKRQKYDKIPCYPSKDAYGLSTARPEKWSSFELAEKALHDFPDTFAGLGLVVTGVQDLTGIDLDKCVRNRVIEPWAQDIISSLNTYTEFSPSGNGLRLWVMGSVPADWTNHSQGIEVYAGHEPRFLTVTGEMVHGSKFEVARANPAVLEALGKQYAAVRASSTVINLHMPEVLDEFLMPDALALDLPYSVKDFLTDGTVAGDRSRVLHAAGVALFSCGLSDAEVFSILATNPYTLEVALDHRNQDTDRALRYLWVEHCGKAKPKATSKIASPDEFENVSPTVLMEALAADDVSAEGASSDHLPAKTKPMRFAFTQVMQYMGRSPLAWAVKGVIPMGEVGAIYGESGAGKSFLALDLMMAVATGVAWRGHRVTQGTVAYVCAEGAGGFALRAKAYADYHGNVGEDTPLHILGDAPNLLEKADVKDLVVALKAIGKISIVVVDTLAQATPGSDENSSEGMGRALAHCKAIHRATGAMVMLVAHAGKDTSRGLRGWSGIKGALDVEICVERSGDKRAATITKMKDGTGEGKEYGFALDTVVLGEDADGDDITSCVLKDGAAPISKGGRPSAVDWQQAVADAYTNLTDLSGSATFTNIVENAVRMVPEDVSAKKDRRPERIKKALETLIEHGKFHQQGEFIVLAGNANGGKTEK